MAQATYGWYVTVAARLKDPEQHQASLISHTGRYDDIDLDRAKDKAVLAFEELNRAIIDPATIEVTFTAPALERRRVGNYI
jgi:lipopolysaccharide biosynthesis regulator YciM